MTAPSFPLYDPTLGNSRVFSTALFEEFKEPTEFKEDVPSCVVKSLEDDSVSRF
jgi:hypothetical protein